MLPRGLALFPQSAELLAMNAAELREQGKLVEALAVTRRAVAIDPTLPQGELSIAQAEFDLGRPDSALAALHRLVDHARGVDVGEVAAPAADASPLFPGEMLPVLDGQGGASIQRPPPTAAMAMDDRARDSVLTTVAQFALAKGNTLLRAADATRRGDAFRLALGFLTLADSLNPTIQSSFLIGTAALGAASASITEAATVKRDGGGCEMMRASAPMLALARTALDSGREVAPDAVQQYLAYLGQLDAFVEGQLGMPCAGAAP